MLLFSIDHAQRPVIIFFLLAILCNSHAQEKFAGFRVETPNGFEIGLEPFDKSFKLISGDSDDGGFLYARSYRMTTCNPVNDSCKYLKGWPNNSQDQTYKIANTGSRALVNIFFIGFELKEGVNALKAKPTPKELYLTSDYIKDIVIQNEDKIFRNTEPLNASLLLISLPKQAEPVKNSIKEFFRRDSIRLHSECFYIIINTANRDLLPNVFKEAQYEEISFGTGTSSQQASIGNSEREHAGFGCVVLESKTAKLDFYHLVSMDGTRQRNNFSSPMINFDPVSWSGLEINKPFGYNIFKKGEPDTTGILEKKFMINPTQGHCDTLDCCPVNFTLVFIDPTNGNNILINRYIDSIAYQTRGLLLIYLAWRDKPVIAQSPADIENIKAKIFDLTFETAIISKDISRITEMIQLKSIAGRMNIAVHLVLPYEGFYDNYHAFNKRFRTIAPDGIFSYNICLSIDKHLNEHKDPGVNIHYLINDH